MNAWQLIWRNALHRKTLSLLTVLSVAIAAALLLLVSLVQGSMESGAAKGYGPYELVIGAQGSDTQLVLNTFYHLGVPVGNIPYSVYEDVSKSANVDKAYPITRGDSLQGYPIIGVDSGYFTTRYATAPKDGAFYGKTGEAVLGAHVAKTLGLKVGDEFHGSHGAVPDEHGDEGHEKFVYHVVGILPPLHTADDKGVFTTLDYAWAVHGHHEEAGGLHQDEADEKAITAIVVKPKGLMELQMLKLKYNKQANTQAVYSSKVVADLLNMMDTGTAMFNLMAAICLLLASISLLLSLMTAASERRRDVGLLRLLGKSRSYVLSTIMLEGVLLTGVGVVVGLLLGHVGAWAAQDVVFNLTGIEVLPWQFSPYEGFILLGAVVLGALASLWPSLRMYNVQPVELFR